MIMFRTLLITIFVVITGCTLVTISREGLNLLPVFFGAMATMQWPGQFNLDFTCLLLLSGLWISWRHQFSPGGVVLGLVATVGGGLSLSVDLLFGPSRAAA